MTVLSFDTTTQEYIEIIRDLQKRQKVARVKDIAISRGVTRSSVSLALALLKEKDLVRHEQYGLVELTEKGEELGQVLEKRHQTLKIFFENVLGMDSSVAEHDACTLEHVISTESIDRLCNFIEFLDQFSKAEKNLIAIFQNEYGTTGSNTTAKKS